VYIEFGTYTPAQRIRRTLRIIHRCKNIHLELA